ncbi:hypothetical protein BH20GEM1_BH20GEM1_04040 [soil metagenome]
MSDPMPAGFVRLRLEPDSDLPVALAPGPDGTPAPVRDLDRAVERIAAARPDLEALLDRRGAVLLRGLLPAETAAFDAALDTLAPDLKPYTEGQSQRSRVEGRIYTSTEYPSDQEIVLHNELSYTRTPPRRLYFFCLVPPATGGETPIVDCRRLHEALDPDVRDPLVQRGVRYVKNMHGASRYGSRAAISTSASATEVEGSVGGKGSPTPSMGTSPGASQRRRARGMGRW